MLRTGEEVHICRSRSRLREWERIFCSKWQTIPVGKRLPGCTIFEVIMAFMERRCNRQFGVVDFLRPKKGIGTILCSFIHPSNIPAACKRVASTAVCCLLRICIFALFAVRPIFTAADARRTGQCWHKRWICAVVFRHCAKCTRGNRSRRDLLANTVRSPFHN
jgi:hypothetical protein